MNLKELSIQDKKTFDSFLKIKRHELSVYAFQNIFSWKSLFAISWIIIEESLCVFFKDSMGCFLYLEPLTKKLTPETVEEVFKVMDTANRNNALSRIENIEEEEVAFYEDAGYACVQKFPEYLYKRADLAGLEGNRFKSKRAACNYFTKNYRYEYIPFTMRYKDACLALYMHWMKERRSRNSDTVYQAMLKDNLSSLSALLAEYNNLDMIGGVVTVEKALKAFTFGFKLNADTFCILFEISDLSVKGISQFIFRKFCEELKEHTYINIMDDSGLENLKKVKRSYHPVKLLPSYIVKRPDA